MRFSSIFISLDCLEIVLARLLKKAKTASNPLSNMVFSFLRGVNP